MNGRRLEWEGCVNVRDLGGLQTASGGSTRFRRVVRSDNVRRLSPHGWQRATGYGVRRIVDLRFVRERHDEAPAPDGVDVVAISLFGELDPAETERADAVIRRGQDEAETIELFYLDTLERRSDNVAAAIEAVASAPDGVVLVHCFVGKDRTGIVSALLLSLAGVADDDIATDYAMSGPVVGSLVDAWIAQAGDGTERAFRTRVSAAPAEGMHRTLRGLRERWGSAEEYLLGAGLVTRDLALARGRLTG
jgi:protein tyrosine/serine phosphatase